MHIQYAMYTKDGCGSRKLPISLSINDAVRSPAVRVNGGKQLRYADVCMDNSTFVLLWLLGVPILDGELILRVEFRK